MSAIFPLVFASEEARLLTAIGIGLLFGFSLERAGFGNARKLAGQFYLYDMTVFKVMFTAVLVAMVGLYGLAGAGLVDLSRLYINPTFVWAQVVGGGLIGVGFMMSGLCPGTSAVSAASGRIDGLVTLLGIFVGTLVFAVAVDWFPVINRLYEGGSLGTSVLPVVLHLPVPVFVLLVVAMAAAAFVGAEKVERIFQARHAPVELSPVPTGRTPRIKFAVTGALAGLMLVSVAWRTSPPVAAPRMAAAITPLDLAEAIVHPEPNLMILDLRRDRPDSVRAIPGAVTVDSGTVPAGLARGVIVVVYDDRGTWTTVPAEWPDGPAYRYLTGGVQAWAADVLTPLPVSGASLEQQGLIARQHALAAFFSGAAAAAPSISAPAPVLPAGGGPKKKRVGGC